MVFVCFRYSRRVLAVLTIFMIEYGANYAKNFFLPPLGLKGVLSNLKILPSGAGGASNNEKCHFRVAVRFSKISVVKSVAYAHV